MSNDETFPEEFRFVTGPVRPGAHPVHVHNEGLAVFSCGAFRPERSAEAGMEVYDGMIVSMYPPIFEIIKAVEA